MSKQGILFQMSLKASDDHITDITDTNKTVSWDNRKDWEKKPQANFHDKPLESAFLSRKWNVIEYKLTDSVMFIGNSMNIFKSILYNYYKGQRLQIARNFKRDLARQTLLIPMLLWYRNQWE